MLNTKQAEIRPPPKDNNDLKLFNPGNNTIINTATKDAPADIPVIPGSAKGFFTTTCKSTPHIAKFPPTNIAIIILGNLSSLIIDIFPSLEPVNIPLISSI